MPTKAQQAVPPADSLIGANASPLQLSTTAADTSATTAAETDTTSSVFTDVSSFFRQVIEKGTSGDWQGLSDLFYEGLVSLTSLLLGNGVEALAAFVILFVIYKATDRTLRQVLEHSKRVDAGLQSLLQKTFRVVALTFIVAIVLSQLGVNVTALVAGLSIVGIAVGFAARDSMENFIAGVTILIDKPFKVGDYIEMQGHYGQVDEITLRSTRIRNVRNEVMVLPNTQMITSEVINHTKQNVIRVDVDFGIAYKEYPQEAREVLLPLFEGDDRVLSSPEPTVVVTGMGDSAVTMAVRFYIREPSKEVPIRWEYTEKVREALREADIEIPFPHLQMFLDEAKGLHRSTLFPDPKTDSDATPSDER